MNIGFIGQGWIGKNYADNFEGRGFGVVRYGLEDEYKDNKDKIKECDIVFIAVPTPTTPDGFSSEAIKSVLPLVGVGKIAVIKSTILPGTTEKLQEAFPDTFVFNSPEFLSESTAREDADNPFMNIVGIPVDSKEYREKADTVHSVLPKSPFSQVCKSKEAEIIKYAHNISGYFQIVLFNLMYDIANSVGAEWTSIEKAMRADPNVASRYSNPVHKNGRGAGGGCFIKDFAALKMFYSERLAEDTAGVDVWKSLEQKNIELLRQSQKDIELLKGVYGEGVVN